MEEDPPMPDVRIENVTKKFGTLVAVNDVSMHIQDKEYFSLLGPSGCGKTTLLRLIAGLIQPDTGKIYIGDRLVNDVPPEDRDIGFVFQTFALFPHMNVWDNVIYGPRVKGYDMKKAGTIGDEVLEMVRLHERSQAFPNELSGGMMQRIMIAIALACNPKLLIADEPTTALDVTIQAQILELIQGLREERKMSILFITHDLGIIAENAARVGIMYAGRIMELAETQEIFSNPRHPYTMGLLGSLPKEKGKELVPIPGFVPRPEALPPGCKFSDRCGYVIEPCRKEEPQLAEILPGHHARCIRANEISWSS